MKKHSTLNVWILLTLLSAAVAACAMPGSAANIVTATPTASPAPAQKTFDDPFQYCAAVGTVDTPDARYAGPQIPDAIINGYKLAAGLENSTEPMEMLQKTTIWRCMDGQVYACNFGANLPCSSKANTDKTPSQAMVDYCAANPNSDFIPMSVTGHSTIYSWHCVKSTPELLDQIEKVDADGYLALIWYPIALNPTPKPETSPTPTLVPSATPASLPSQTPTPLGASGEVLFACNCKSPYNDLYLLDITRSQLTRLTGRLQHLSRPVFA